MRSFELHEISTPHDLVLADTAGLPTHDSGECASCGNEVGVHGEEFKPFAIALSDEHDWLLCRPCSAPALHPHG